MFLPLSMSDFFSEPLPTTTNNDDDNDSDDNDSDENNDEDDEDDIYCNTSYFHRSNVQYISLGRL